MDYTATGIRPYNPARGYMAPTGTVAPAPVTVQPISPVATGIEPQAYEAILYGKTIPKWVGSPLMGGRLIEGPFWTGTQADPLVSAIWSFGEPVNPNGTRVAAGVRLRGASYAYDGSGNFTDASVAGAQITFKTGTETQTPFASSVGRYGAKAVPYRHHALCEITNLPVKPFGGILPFVSVKWNDSTYGDPDEGITWTDAIKEFLRDMRIDDADFEVDVQHRALAMIVDSEGNQSLESFLSNLRKLYVHWDITYRDKIRIIEPAALTIVAELNDENCVRDSIRFTQGDALQQNREKQLRFIDIDRDYEPNVAAARAEVFPTATTDAISTETIEFPAVMNASEAQAAISVSLFEELAAQDQHSATAMVSLFGIEAGDGYRASHGDVPLTIVARVFEVQRDLRDFKVDVTGVEVLNCGVECDDIPVGALAFLDFICPQYFIGVTEYELETVIGGTGTPEVIEGEGLKIDGLNGSWPVALGDFFDLLESLILGDGFTIVFEFKTIDAGVTGYFMYAHNAGDTKNIDLSYDLDADPDNNFVRGATSGSVNPAVVSSPFGNGTVQRVAYTFLRDPTFSDGGHQAISVNGEAVDAAESDEDLGNVAEIHIGHALEANPAGYIRKIEVYALKDDGDLPDMSDAP